MHCHFPLLSAARLPIGLALHLTRYNGYWMGNMVFCAGDHLPHHIFPFRCLSRKISRLPPGPPRWPIVGNLLQLGNNPNQSLFHLATKYGPLMSLSHGMKTTVVVSSAAMAKEVLKTNDHLLAGRIVMQSVKALSYDKSSMGFIELGSHWRMLRRISTTELFSVKRLEALRHLRRDQAFRTIRQIL